MNILFINSYDCSPNSSGGVNRVIGVLSHAMTVLYGYRCFLGYFEDNPARPLAEFADRIKLNANFDEAAFEDFIKHNAIDIIQVNFLKKQNLPTIENMYRIARRNGVKLVYAFHVCPGFQMVTYGSFERTWYGLRFHDNFLQESKKWMLTITRHVLNPIFSLSLRHKYAFPLQNCDKIVLLSKYYIAPYLKLAHSKDTLKCSAIGNALTYNRFATEQDILQKEKEVLVVARFDEDTKRISLILKVWRQIEQSGLFDDWRLTLVGDGRDMPFYQYLTKKYALRQVFFEGYKQPESYYKRSSIFLMTSSAEGWPMVLTESMQWGNVVVAFDSFGSLHDLVTNGKNGVIVKNNDISQFYKALSSLMKQDEEIQRMAHNAVESSMRFKQDDISKQWNVFYTNVCDKRD